MFVGKALRCDCGYQVPAKGDAADLVDAIRRHSRDAHGIEFSVELALDVARRSGLLPSGPHKLDPEEISGKEKQ